MGNYQSGNINYLTFIADDDASQLSNGQYRNVRLYEQTPTYNPPTLLVNGVTEANNLSDPAGALNGLDEITVLVEVQATQIGTDKGIFDTEAPDDGDDVLGMRYDVVGSRGGGNNVIKIALQTTQGELQLESAANVQTTNPQHLVMTWQSGGALKLFIDGVETTPTYVSGALGGVITDVQDLLLGQGPKNAGGWAGTIDNFQIYDTALDSTQIQNLYNYGTLEGSSDIHITSAIPDYIDPSVLNITSYADQDNNPTLNTTSTSIELSGNTWKKMAFSYDVTPNSVLEFDFSSTQEGEIHGIGLDTNNSQESTEFFRIFGTQTGYGLTDYDGIYTSGTQTYKIDLSTVYSGSYNYITFINDHDSAPGNGHSLFENIRIYEETDLIFDSVYGGTSGANTFVFDEMPNTSRIYKIENFNSVEDVLDLSSLLDPITTAITDFVEITDNGSDSFVAVDVDGGGDNFVHIATITGVTGLTNEDALETNGTLIA